MIKSKLESLPFSDRKSKFGKRGFIRGSTISHGWEDFHGQLAFQPAFTTELTKKEKKKTFYPLALDMGVSPAYRLLKTESLLTIKLFFFIFFYGQLSPLRNKFHNCSVSQLWQEKY